ncbi:hypothetical protein C8R46DRAFT_968659 [Mycena filopes]|nr:hypothetical protein C8R46DRAFT_968659 [Mycena filopes]
MPVTFPVASHPANAVKFNLSIPNGFTAKELLARSCRKENEKAQDILQFALSGETEGGSGRDLTSRIPNILPARNGFVGTAIKAYNDHHALVIRPDDVWLAILCQFNFFVNANAELLRANFVAHEGKQELVIAVEGTRFNLDFGDMARQMVGQIEKNVVDPTLRAWVVPTFTTTTDTDRTVGAVLMMATLKEYFEYVFLGLACGLPRVTLEGERADWVNILGRLEKLKEYGVETIAWYHLLRPVIARFVAAFDAPTSQANVDFWQKIAHYEAGFSGPSYYSGWINAFNVFSEKGAWLGNKLDLTKSPAKAPESMTAKEFWATFGEVRGTPTLVFDDTPYHTLDSSKVPMGYTDVDVKLNDNGELFDCLMVAGSIGTRVLSSNDLSLSSTGEDDVVTPVVGWWMFTKKDSA